MDPAAVGRDRLVACVGCVALLAAGVFPWVGTPSGISLAPGVYSLPAIALGAGTALLVVRRDWTLVDHLAVLAVGGLTLIYSAYRFVDPRATGLVGVPAPDVSPGLGVYFALVGSTLLVGAAALALFADTGDSA